MYVYGILMSSRKLPSGIEQRVSSDIKMDDTDPNLKTANQSALLPLLDSLSPAEIMTMFGLTWNAKATDVPAAVARFIAEQPEIAPADIQALQAAGKGLGIIMTDIENEAENLTADQKDALAGEYKLLGLKGSDQLYNWMHFEAMEQEDPQQNSRLVSRYGKVAVGDASTSGEHSTMKRERIGVNQSADVPVTQGTMNPTLRNTSTVQITIDSANRQTIMAEPLLLPPPFLPIQNTAASLDPNGNSSATNFLMNFSEPLTNVLSFTLTSASIPFTFYNIEASMGNNYMYVNGESLICISGGNYSPTQLVETLSGELVTYGIIPTYNHIDHTVSMENTGPADISLSFYDLDGKYTGCGEPCGPGPSVDGNLGFLLGFRSNVSVTVPVSDIVIPANTTVKAPAVLKLNTNRYFVLIIDDFNYNYVNMTQVIQDDIRPLVTESVVQGDLSYVCHSDITSANPLWMASAPRKHTAAQLYALNQKQAPKLSYSHRQASANVPNAFATLGYSTYDMELGGEIGITSGIDQASRTFFGPTTIDKMRIRLINSVGQTVNLHGNDWHFNLSVTRLYQY